MGQGDNPANPGAGLITVPTRVGDRDDWTFVAMAGTVVAAINSEGHLYTWGEGTNGTLGHGDMDNRYVPTRVEGRSDWAMVSVGGRTAHMIAATDDGHLYAWGNNASGRLGLGFSGGNQTTPQRVEFEGTVLRVLAAHNVSAVINTDGELYVWGSNDGERLGLGDTTDRYTPTRLGEADNWIDITAALGNAPRLFIAALNADGEIYTWGHAGVSAPVQLGRPVAPEALSNVPKKITGSNWIAIGGGNAHFMAMTECLRLYAWGSNTSGQLGIGEIGGYRDEPTFVLQAYGLAGFSQTGAGTHSMALIRTVPIEAQATLTKNLQMPEGTTLLTDKTFTFTFERHSFNDNTTQSNLVPNIPNRTITITNTSTSSTQNNITTRSNSLDMLEGIEFTGPGIFRWIIEETQSSIPPTTHPSSMTFSQARYELSVWVEQAPGVGGALSIYYLSLVPLTVDNNTQTAGTKVEAALFTNTYTRTILTSALIVSKTVEGNFANQSTPFDFEVTLTRTAFCTTSTSFTGQVFQGTNPVGSPITFESGVMQTVTLTHNQRIVFDELVIGTSFNLTELAAPDFRAQATLQVGGVAVAITPNAEPDTDLPLGTHLIAQGANTAAFVNTHVFPPPTGLSINSVSYAALVLPFLGLVALLSAKRRKNIEDLSLM